jgi:DNA-binding CsgD family transcriptional regulator
MIVQRLKKENEDSQQLAERYYEILSSLNSLSLTKREIQLVAYTAIHGNISYPHLKEEFCIRYKTSIQTIYNMVSRLMKLKVMVKNNGNIKVNPVLVLKFDETIVMQISLIYGIR